MKACLGRGSLPGSLLALGPDRGPIGIACMTRMSAGATDFPGPWLATLYVREECRGQGVATDLVFAAEAEARRLAFPALYASVPSRAMLLRRCGWTALGSGTSPSGETTVWGKYLI